MTVCEEHSGMTVCEEHTGMTVCEEHAGMTVCGITYEDDVLDFSKQGEFEGGIPFMG